MAKCYVAILNGVGRWSGEVFGSALIIGWRRWWGMRILRTGMACALSLSAIAPIMVPAQMTSQQRIDDHESRIRSMERQVAELRIIVRDIDRLTSGQNQILRELSVLSQAHATSSTFFSSVPDIAQTLAIVVGGIWMLTQMRKRREA